MRKKFIYIIFTLLSVSQGVLAQNSMLRYADEKFELAQYRSAAEIYVKAFEKRQKYETARMAALSYGKNLDYENAFLWWEKAFDLNQTVQKEDMEQYLKMALTLRKFDELPALAESKGYHLEDFPDLQMDVIQDIWQHQSKGKLVAFNEANSEASDFGTAMDSSGRTYFSSDRSKVKVEGDVPAIRLDARKRTYDSDIYDWTGREYLKLYTIKDKEVNEVDIATQDTALMHVSEPALMTSKSLLFFSATRKIRKIKKRRSFNVYPELFFGKLGEDGKLSDIQAFPFNSNVAYGLVSPFIDEQSKRIYFASNMPGGLGGYDLYYSEYDEQFNFTAPVNLGNTVNTPGNERDPYFYQQTFFFSSNGHPGLGGQDIFKAESTGDTFTQVVNLGQPFNSVRDDFAYKQFGANDVYISSNREDGVGLDDIYRLAEQVKRLRVRVVDCRGNEITGLTPVLKDNENTPVEITEEKGSYLSDLEMDVSYTLTISQPGYFAIRDNEINTTGMTADLLEREYVLVNVPEKQVVYTDIIYYDLDKSLIRKDATAVMEHIYQLMDKYTFLNLFVGAHTDARASLTYNEALSENRAAAVKEYLMGKGIDGERVVLSWHGETEPVNQCVDGANCSSDQHQLNRRSELLLRIDPASFADGLPEGTTVNMLCDPLSLVNKIMEESKWTLPIVYFDFDKWNLRTVHMAELERLALLLRHNPNVELILEGHTDIRGSLSYNEVLSRKRAEVVKTYLANRGVEEHRITYTYLGETHPVHDCQDTACTAEEHQLNRRTEVKIK